MSPLFGPPRPEPVATWDEKLKRVTVNVGSALLTIVLVLGLCITVVLLLIKLGVWALS